VTSLHPTYNLFPFITKRTQLETETENVFASEYCTLRETNCNCF